MSTVSKALAQAAELARDGKWDATLTALLTAWERSPTEALREVVLAVEDAEARPPFEGDGRAWLDLAKKAKPPARGPLLSALKGATLAEAQDRLDVAAAWAKDPRTSRAVERLLAEVPWSSDSSKRAWTAAFGVVAASGDPRFVALSASLPKTWKVREGIRGWLERAFARSISQLPPEAPALSPADEKQLEAIRAALARVPAKKPASDGRDEATLLRAVYDNPEDDAPRLVLADVLQERGDPRGEFIALQCAGTDEKKAKALLKAHGKKWLGPLAPVLGADFEFRRGFPAVGLVKFRHQADAEKYGNLPEWATFEELTWSASYPPAEQVPFCRWAGPSMRWLKRAVGVHVPHLLASDGWPRLEELSVAFGQPHLLQELLAAQPTKFPKLTSLSITDEVDDAWFSNIPSLGGVKTLRVQSRAPGKLLPVVSRLGVGELWVGDGLTFRRGKDSHLSALTVTVSSSSASRVMMPLKSLPPNTLESVDYQVAKGATLPAEVKKAVGERLKARGQPSAFETAARAAEGPQRLGELGNVKAMGMQADGTLVVVENSRLHFVTFPSLEVKRTVPLDDVDDALVYANGTRALLLSYKRLQVLDLTRGGAQLFSSRLKAEPCELQLSDDERLATTGRGGVRFDLEKRKELPPPRGAGKASVLSPDGAWWTRWKGNGLPYEVLREGSSKGVPLEGGLSFTGPQCVEVSSMGARPTAS
ncbi:MAG: TIGR02996 domain-containing protein [Myxococcota bacterium]